MAVREAGGDPFLALDVQIDEFVAIIHTSSLPVFRTTRSGQVEGTEPRLAALEAADTALAIRH